LFSEKAARNILKILLLFLFAKYVNKRSKHLQKSKKKDNFGLSFF